MTDTYTSNAKLLQQAFARQSRDRKTQFPILASSHLANGEKYCTNDPGVKHTLAYRQLMKEPIHLKLSDYTTPDTRTSSKSNTRETSDKSNINSKQRNVIFPSLPRKSHVSHDRIKSTKTSEGCRMPHAHHVFPKKNEQTLENQKTSQMLPSEESTRSQENRRRRCKFCGSMYHSTNEHYSGKLQTIEKYRRMQILKKESKVEAEHHGQKHFESSDITNDGGSYSTRSHNEESVSRQVQVLDRDQQTYINHIESDKTNGKNQKRTNEKPKISYSKSDNKDKVEHTRIKVNLENEKSKSFNSFKIRANTMHNLRSPTNKSNENFERSKSADKASYFTHKPRTQNSNFKLHAYHSVAKIPQEKPRKGNSSTKSSEASEQTNLSISSQVRTSESSKSTTPPNTSGSMWHMKELIKYRKAMAIYLDERWQNNRKEKFYDKLEQLQLNQQRKKNNLTKKEKQKIHESKDRQLEQLRLIREKHQKIRTRRLSTQHVKWKYVLGSGESDREQYGLPSEYYTYYGFTPDETKKLEKSPMAVSQTRKTQSARKQHSSQKSLLPSENEQQELRRKNKKRFNHLFATRSKTQSDLIGNIIREGLFTVDIPQISEENKLPDENISKLRSPEKRPPVRRKTSRLLVKDVVDDAKHILDTLDENCADDLESISNAER
ncbi:uncharacterized protein LOC120335847 [Styela clava]